MATSNISFQDQNADDEHTIDDLDDSPEIPCHLCGLKFNGASSYELHINGKKHNSKVRAMKIKSKIAQPNKESTAVCEDMTDTLCCALCKLNFSGYLPFNQHLKSNKHLKQCHKDKLNEHLKNTPEVLTMKTSKEADSGEFLGLPEVYGKCDICSKTFYAPESLKQHMESPAHLKKVTQANMKTRLQSNIVNHGNADIVINDESAPNTDGNITKPYAECRTCGKKFSGVESFQMHLVSNGHQKQIEMQKLEKRMKEQGEEPVVVIDGKYLCKECDKFFDTCMALKQHFENNNHDKTNSNKDSADLLSKYPEITKLSSTANVDAASGEESAAQTTGDFYVCKSCECCFTGPKCALQHAMSQKHKRAKDIKKLIKAAGLTAATVSSERKVSSAYGANHQNTDNENADSFEIIH